MVNHASADADLRIDRAHDCPTLVEDELWGGNCIDYGDFAGKVARSEVDREVWRNRECCYPYRCRVVLESSEEGNEDTVDYARLICYRHNRCRANWAARLRVHVCHQIAGLCRQTRRFQLAH